MTSSSVDTIGYVRVSTEQQVGENKTSLGEQRRLIAELAVKNGRVLLDTSIFEDAGISGATAEARPGFMAMVEYCKTNPRPQINRGLVCVLNDSRFGRFDDPEEAGAWRYLMKKAGWDVRFTESDDVNDPLGRGMMRLIGSAQATAYRTNLVQTAKRSARATAQKGFWQQEAPLGYRRLATRKDGAQRVLDIGQRKSEDETSRLTRGPESEVEIVRYMFESYGRGGVSLGSLAKDLAARFPVRKWSRSTVGATLRNAAYMGDVLWCRRVTNKTERLARTVRDKSEWVETRDAHPPIISRELFALVQARMATNKRQTTATVGGYPLGGLIRCGDCGHHFAGGGGRKGPPEDVDRYRFYRDTGATSRIPDCQGPMMTLRKRWLEEKVIAAVTSVAMSPKIQRLIKEEVERAMLSTTDVDKERRIGLEREKEKLMKSRKRLVDAIASGTLDEADAAGKMGEIKAQLASCTSEIERLRFSERATRSVDGVVERMVATAQDFPTQVARLQGGALRDVLAPWIADAVVHKQKRELVLTLWRVPGAASVFHLNNSPAPGSP